MKQKLVTLGLIPLLAVFIGWSIQPVGYNADLASGHNEVWPDFAKAQFSAKQEDPAFAMNSDAPHFVADHSARN